MTRTSTNASCLLAIIASTLIQAVARRLIAAKFGELDGVVVVSSAALAS